MAFDSKPRQKTVSAFANLTSETLLRRLEPRIMFDAAALDTALDALHVDPAHAVLADATPGDLPLDLAPGAALHGSDLVGLVDHLDGPVAVQSLPGARTIVFIDANVPDLAVLEAAIANTSEIAVLDPTKDGLDQMAAYLANRHDLDAIHIISHGEPGKLHLGSSTYDAATLKAFGAELGQIGASLHQGGDILIYGCEVGQGTAGDAFVHKFADLTHADVAASADDTGAAVRHGDWALETHTGVIDAALINAPEWNGILAPLVISTHSQPSLVPGSGALPAGALWTDAGTVGATHIDLRATVISWTPDPNAPVSTYTFDTSAVGASDDPRVKVQGGELRIEWAIFETGTSNKATGDVNFFVADIDAFNGGDFDGAGPAPFLPYTPPAPIEFVSADKAGLYSFATETATHLTTGYVATSATNGVIEAKNLVQSQNAEPESGIKFSWRNVDSWQVVYKAPSPPVGGYVVPVPLAWQSYYGTDKLIINDNGLRFFVHDGDGDLSFAAAKNTGIPQIDLDANNSSLKTGQDYQATYTENGPGVPIGDTDVLLEHLTSTTLAGATIHLTNALTGDVLSAGGLPGNIIASAYDPATGIMTLSGTATLAEYQTAIHAITFANSGENPGSADRTIDVYVTDGKFPSDVATATIHVVPVNDAPVAVNDSGAAAVGTAIVIDVLANDSDVDNALDPASVHIVGTASNGASLTVAGEGVWSVNAANGKITFTPATGFIGVPTAVSYTVADLSGAISSPATVSILPIHSAPHLDLSGPTPKDGGYLYGHNGTGFTAGWQSPIGLERFTNVGNEGSGPGLTLTQNGSSGYFTGAAGATLSDAIAQKDYITNTFTTTATLPETWLIYTAKRLAYGPQYQYSVVISSDGFQSATLLSQDNPGEDYAGPIYDANSNYRLAQATDFKLAANTTYEVRVYVYGVAGGAATTATWDDYYTLMANDPTGYVNTFNAGGAAVAISAPTLELEDSNSANMVSGSIVLTNAQTADHFAIGGVLTGNGSAATLNGIHYAVTESGGTISIALSGSASKAQYAAFINSVQFENTSANPAIFDRTISVTVSDGVETSNVAMALIHVNVAPEVFVSLGDQPAKDGDSVAIATKGGFSDPNGDALSFTASGLPAWLSIGSATGKITGTLPADASIGGIAHDGVYAIDVTATDPSGLAVTQTFNFSAHNVAPTAVNDGTITTNEDATATFDVRANDHDGGLDGDALSVAQIDGHAIEAGGPPVQVANGEVTLGLDGKLTFRPALDFTGATTFSYQVSDGQGGAATASVLVDVLPINDAPIVAIHPIGTGDVIVVDANVPHAQALIDALPANATVIIVPADVDGVRYLEAALAGLSNITALHIVSQGEAGDLTLGTSHLTEQSISTYYKSKLASIGTHMSYNGDILVYGCNFAQNMNAVVALATATNADVAGSIDQTGAAALGGNWDLEANSGLIQASAISILPYDSLLAPPAVAVSSAAPTTVVPTFIAAEDTPKVLTGISFADPDAGSANVTVTLSVVHGALDINLAVAGGVTASQVTGDATGMVTITASIAKINATLANATGLTYASALNYNGGDTLTVNINDLGNTGTGGPLNTTSTANIAIAAVNDAPLLDLNSVGSTPDANSGFTATFTEGDGPLHVANGALADINDVAEADITSLNIVVAGATDGAAEKVVIGGKSFDLATNSTQTSAVGGTSVLIAYDAATMTFAVTNSAGAATPMAQADLDTLVRGVTYENTSQAPSATDRTLTFTATDAGGLTSAPAVATLHVVPVNDTPVVSLDPTPAPVNLLANGDFENGFTGWTSQYGITGASVYGPWNVGTGPLVDHTTGDGTGHDLLIDTGFPGGFTGPLLQQTITLVAGQTYTLDYWATPTYPANAPVLEVAIDGAVINTTTLDLAQSGVWQHITQTFLATSTGPVVFSMRDTNPFGGGNDFALDDIKLLAPAAPSPDHVATFTEGSGPVLVAASNADVNDVLEGDITKLTIVAGSNPDGTSEHLVIGGQSFDLATSSTQTSVVGGTTVSIAYDAATKTFAISNGAGAAVPMAQADLDTLVAGIAYENTSDNPSTVDRTLTFTATDAGGLISGPAVATIHVVPVNDPPLLNLDPGNSQGGADNGGIDAGHPVGGAPVLISDADVLISDVDSADIALLTINVIGVADGLAEHIHVGGASGVDIALDGATVQTGAVTVGGTTFVVAYDPASGAITVTNAADLPMSITNTQALIAATTYQDTSPTSTEGPRQIVLTVNDGQVSSSAVAAIIDVHGGVVGAEDTAILLGLNPDDFAAVTSGEVTIEGVPAGATLSSGTLNADGSWTVPITDLAALTLTPELNFNGSFSLEVCGDATGSGGGSSSSSSSFASFASSKMNHAANTAEVCRTLDVTVTPVNDAPVDAMPAAQTVDEDSTLIFSTATGNAISVADPDAGTGVISVDIWADHGVLQLSQTTGLDFTVAEELYTDQVGGAGPQAVIHMTGTLVDINAALEGMRYIPDANYSGPADLHIRTTDNGNTGSGGVLTVTDTVAITVAPTVDAVDDDVTTPEDTAVIVAPMDNDRFGGDGVITAVGSALHGTTAINTDGTVTYVPNANYNGLDSFTYTVTSNTGGWTYQAWSNPTTNTALNPDDNTASDIFAQFPASTADGAGNAMTLSPDGASIEAGLTAELNLTSQNMWLQFDSNLLVGQAGAYTLDIPSAPPGHFAVDDALQVFIDGALVYQYSDLFGPDAVANGAVVLAAGQHTIEVRYFNWYGQSDLAITIAGPDTGNAPIDLATAPNIGVATLTETATVNVTITPVNDAPVAVSDTGVASEDGPATGGNVITGPGADTDIDGGRLYVSSVNGDVSLIGHPVSGSTGGSFVLTADGAWTFDPGHAFDNLAPGQTRDTVIAYIVADGMGGHATATVTVTVTGVNDAPVTLGPIAPQDAHDAAPVTPIDASVAFNNPGNLPLVYTATNLPAGLSIDPATGLITGTPAHDASVQGPYVVMITATGPAGETSTSALQINVANPGPVAMADIATTPVDTPLTIAPLTNDTDVDGDMLSVTSVDAPAHGAATLNPDGTISYVPNPGFVGPETISYTITDGQGGMSSATITIVVGAPPADAPALTGPIPDQMGTDGSPIAPVDVSTFFADSNGQPLSFAATGLPSGLAIDPVSGVISGTPAPDASVQGPYSVVITAVDPDGNQVSTTVLFAIANPAPNAVLDYSATPLDTPVTISVLANDSDPDGDVLTVVSVTPPANGAVVINPDGTLTYTPNAGYSGVDVLIYTISDGQGGTSTAYGVVYVDQAFQILPVVDSSVPTAGSGVDGSPINPIDVGSHVMDRFDTPLSFSATGLPPGLIIDPVTGIITGALGPNASAVGPFTVTVIAIDAYGVQVTMPLVITATNPSPSAADDVASTASNQPVVIGVLANDADPDHDALTVTAASTPAHGTVAINANGHVTFTPDAGYTGSDTFTYTVTDADGASTTATVTINIGVPGPLAAAPAIAPISGGDGVPITPAPVAAAFGDQDPTHPLTLSIDTSALPPGITFVNGAFVGTPAINASQGHTPGQPIGTYVVPVTGTDSGGASTTTYVTFTVSNLPPVAVDDKPTVSEDGPNLTGNVLTDPASGDHDTAPDGDPLTVVGAVQGANTITLGAPFTTAGGGVLTLQADGSYTFNPGTAYNSVPVHATATETITCTISDGNGGTTTAKLIITINGVNDVPIVVDPATGQPIATGQLVIQPQHGTDAQPIQPISAAGFFKDPDAGDVLTYSVINLPKGLHFNPATGLISGVLDKHASVGGPFTVDVTATDNHGGQSTATFVWVIENSLPVAVGEVTHTTNGVALHATVAGNDVDPDTDGVSYRVETGPSHGALTLNADGTFTYVADSQFSGDDSFVYAVVDADGGVSYAVCKIMVDPAINIAQQSGGGAGRNGWHTEHPIETPFRLGSDDVREYVLPVASEQGAETLPDGVTEHIRLVVEGRTQQLDQAYGASKRDVPLHWNLGLGRDAGQGGETVYEPLSDAPFWHGLNPLDFSGLAVREADVGGADASVVASADADQAVPFGDRLAQIRGRFDREALRLMADLEEAA